MVLDVDYVALASVHAGTIVTSNNAVTPVEIIGTIPVQILSRGTCFLFLAVLVEFRTGTLTVGEWACPGIRGPSYIVPKAQIVQSLVY